MLKLLTVLIGISLVTFLLVSCGTDEEPEDISEQTGYRRISADEAYQKMRTDSAFILLDVRTPQEHAEMRIPGSILIPDTEIAKRAEIELPDKNALILVYCKLGRRSETAANELISMGYTYVFDFGGIVDWPYEIEKD